MNIKNLNNKIGTRLYILPPPHVHCIYKISKKDLKTFVLLIEEA